MAQFKVGDVIDYWPGGVRPHHEATVLAVWFAHGIHYRVAMEGEIRVIIPNHNPNCEIDYLYNLTDHEPPWASAPETPACDNRRLHARRFPNVTDVEIEYLPIDPMTPEAKQLVADNRIINAIAEVRRAGGYTLAEAKRIVTAYRDHPDMTYIERQAWETENRAPMLTDLQMKRIMTLFEAVATQDAMELFDRLQNADEPQPMSREQEQARMDEVWNEIKIPADDVPARPVLISTLDDVPATHEAQAQYIAVEERQLVGTQKSLLTYSADELLAALREKTGEPNGMFIKREWLCDAERFLKELLELTEDAIADCWLGKKERPAAALRRVRHLLTADGAYATYHYAHITRERMDNLLDGKG